MATKSGECSVSHKFSPESFENKHERRLELHEILRSRYNITSCRQDNPSWGREQERHSPREQEFFRRRHLWIEESGEKRIRSPTKSNRYIKYSLVKQNSSKAFLNKDLEPLSGNELSWHHNRSKSYPFDCRNAKKDIYIDLLHARTNRNDVPKSDKGVQTVQEVPVICLKRDTSQQTDCATAVLNGELLQLSEYLMEALQRERKLKKKLCVLQELLNVLVQTSEKSWKAQLNEDHLKCKVANLENQMFFYSQNFPKTSVKKVLLEMEEHKQRYQEKAKESLQKLTDDKITTERHLQNTQMSLVVSLDECKLWKEEYENLKGEWTDLCNKHCELKNEMNVLQSKLQWVETQDSQCQQLQNRLQSLEKEKIELQAWNEQLQEDMELQKEQQASLQAELAALEHKRLSDITKDTTLQVCDTDKLLQSDQLQVVTDQLISKEKECEGLKTEVELITEEYNLCQTKLQQCRNELKGTHKWKLKKRCCCWAPVFILMFAVVFAFYVTSHVDRYLY
ncbi:TRAF3-interacting JNK-activating modulator isoform X2 [Pseudophryne corroboree]|uniref:TRAF3-interacting JNK-activating modulator isoform X2 n=1 Tax=Pseudophryne corroboree TaxID=495146 RepID=UPI003081C17B